MRGGPHVGAKLPALNHASSLFLDPNGQPPPCTRPPGEDVVQFGIGTQPKLSLESHDVGDARPKVHATKDIHSRWIVKPSNLDNPIWGLQAHDSWMVRKRPEIRLDTDLYIAEVKALKDRTGKSNKAIAEDIGIELGYFHKILYRDKPLTIQVVEKSAPLFGKLVKDFLMEGTTPDRDESFANIMGFLGPNIPDDVKKHLIALAQSYQPKGVVLVAPNDNFEIRPQAAGAETVKKGKPNSGK